MMTKTIPSSGEQLPVIGLGTLQAFDVDGTPEERTALGDVLKLLTEQGGTLIDSSPRYGRAEAVVGELCAELGLTDALFFATKVFTEGKQAGIEEMNASLRRLQTPVIDLMQVHSMRDWELHLPSIRQLKEQGKVRYIGITIHRDSGHAQMMQLMRNENLDFIQVNYNLVEREAAEQVLPLAQDLGVAVMVNVPFAKADLFKRTRGVPLPGWASDFDCDSWAQFFLKYVISHPAVSCVIPRTGNPRHMADNLMAGFGTMPDQATRLKMEAFIAGLG
jgi:aryl-alcohol dehydrogenase-like predicted oxidoreductase